MGDAKFPAVVAAGSPKNAHKAASRHSIGARRNPETEAAVLRAAMEILRDKGPRGLSMEAVARKARASKATLYRWWPSRGALLLAVYTEGKPRFPMAETGDVLDDVRHLLDGLLTLWANREGLTFSLIIAEAQSDPEVAEALEAFRIERCESLAGILKRAQARGDLRADADPTLLAESIIAMAWMRLLTRRLSPDGAAMARSLLGGWIRDVNNGM